ncbi:MAG: cell division protein FtsQ/DivIB, partial [Actinomycetota bacterium]
SASLAIITVIVLGIGAWVFLTSAFFAVREVRIEGSRSLPAEELRELAAIEMGDNLITLATDGIEDRLESDPWILRAGVQRDLPQTVVITVVERRPAGWLDDPDGSAIVAGDGTVLERSPNPPERLPDLGSWPDALIPGHGIDELDGALRVTSSMAPSTLGLIEAVEVSGLDVTMSLRGGGEVVYGQATEIQAKNSALGDMLRWAREEGLAIKTIDVRVPSAPSLAPAQGPALSPTFS